MDLEQLYSTFLCISFSVLMVIVAPLTLGEIICNKIYYVKRGTEAMITCEHNESFNVIRWYRQGESKPVVRIERTQTFTSEEYDITQRGDMIIKNVELKHGGVYTILGLTQDGETSEASAEVYVTVPMSDAPSIGNCNSSYNEICNGVKYAMKATTLVCSSGESRPAAEMQWYRMAQNGTVLVQNIKSAYIMNVNTSLYISSSIIQYDDDSSILQMFTCIAKGVAVEELMQSSVLIESERPIKILESSMNAKKGSAIVIQCSQEIFKLYRWKVTFANGTSVYLTPVYPLEKGYCDRQPRCQVIENGTLLINEVSHEDEGTYECLITDLITSTSEVKHLTVVVPPEPPTPVIKGCEEEDVCRLQVSNYSGSLQCSMLKARPKVKLSWISDGTDNVVLYNKLNDFTEGKEKGTFDTTSTIDYKTEECHGEIHIQCIPDADHFHEQYSSAEVILITDTSKCTGSRAVLLVLLIVLFLIALFVITILWLKREKVCSLLSSGSQSREKSKEDDATEKDLMLCNSNLSPATSLSDPNLSPPTSTASPQQLESSSDHSQLPDSNLSPPTSTASPQQLESSSDHSQEPKKLNLDKFDSTKISEILEVKGLLLKLTKLIGQEENERDPEEVEKVHNKVQKVRKTFLILEKVIEGNNNQSKYQDVPIQRRGNVLSDHSLVVPSVVMMIQTLQHLDELLMDSSSSWREDGDPTDSQS